MLQERKSPLSKKKRNYIAGSEKKSYAICLLLAKYFKHLRFFKLLEENYPI
jgi:hypothetical protein